MKGQDMSEKVSKSRVSPLTYFAFAAFALLAGFYVTSRIQHWHVSGPSVKTDTGLKQNEISKEDRAREYASSRKVFLEKVADYKAVLAKVDNAAVFKLLNDRMSYLSAIEDAYIKLRPNATEPERIKLKKMVGDYSSVYDQIVKLDYQLILIREARAEVTNAHSLLLLSSPEHYAEDKDEVKKILKETDAGTFNLYQTGILKKKVDFLTEICLHRLKPEGQEETPELRLQAGMEAIELYLNDLTVRNAPPKKDGE